jgi:hypothetical protein
VEPPCYIDAAWSKRSASWTRISFFTTKTPILISGHNSPVGSVYYIPTAVAYHVANATSRRLSDLHVYYHTRNLEFVWMKNMPLGLMLRFAHHKVIQELGSFCYLCLRHGKWGPFFRAKRDALSMLPVMLRMRAKIQAAKRVPNRYVRSVLMSMFTFDFFRQKMKQLRVRSRALIFSEPKTVFQSRPSFSPLSRCEVPMA